MIKDKLKNLLRSKVFLALYIFAGLYFIGFILYLTVILPNRVHMNQFQGLSDIFHILYWRWWLDWGIIVGYILILSSCMLFFKMLEKWVKATILARYFLPVIVMVLNFIGMVALDIAITFFADVYIAGNWLSPDLVWGGMTPQRIYHGFFFWVMPSMLIIGYPIHNFILTKKERLSSSVKMFFLFMACYSFTLGFLDPIVCQNLWDDWTAFGGWDMGTGAMFATGWIAHYTIFGLLWIIGIFLVNKVKKEITVEKVE